MTEHQLIIVQSALAIGITTIDNLFARYRAVCTIDQAICIHLQLRQFIRESTNNPNYQINGTEKLGLLIED